MTDSIKYTEFVNESAKKLDLNEEDQIFGQPLPFIGKKKSGAINFWDVPKEGGYSGGCLTGEALACTYLKFAREVQTIDGMTGLPNIILDMFNIPMTNNPENVAFRGQVVGFFTTLEQWIYAISKMIEDKFDDLEYEELLEVANLGLAFDEEAYEASTSDSDMLITLH